MSCVFRITHAGFLHTVRVDAFHILSLSLRSLLLLAPLVDYCILFTGIPLLTSMRRCTTKAPGVTCAGTKIRFFLLPRFRLPMLQSFLCDYRLLRDNWKTHFFTVNELCNNLYNQEHRSPYLLGFMVDLLDEDIANGYTASSAEEKSRLLQKLVEICNDLAQLHDRVRQTYWTWIRDTFQFKYNILSETVPEV